MAVEKNNVDKMKMTNKEEKNALEDIEEKIELKCVFCGGKLVGTRAKENGHFRGRCENCGARIIA